jgi:two-component system response regulator
VTTLRVLLVEDDEDHVFLLRRALSDLPDVEVELATERDGEGALRYLEFRQYLSDDERPHLVVLDLRIPRVSGFDVLRWIRFNPVFASLPVVVLTSSERREDADTARGLGANEVMSKPLAGLQLRHDVQAMAKRWDLVLAGRPG